MTNILREAFQKAEALPEREQIALAGFILEELSSEERWRNLLDSSQGPLTHMAREALAEYHAGETRPLDPDTL